MSAAFAELPAELFPAMCGAAGIAFADAADAQALTTVPDGPAKIEGIAIGRAAAEAIIELREGDHANDPPLVDVGYPRGTELGQYKDTPGTPFAFAPPLGVPWRRSRGTSSVRDCGITTAGVGLVSLPG